jgi:ribokinase
MSVACARAGATCVHLGAVGPDGGWAVERLTQFGVDTRRIYIGPDPTGHAIIAVDAGGENTIIICPGANRAIPGVAVTTALTEAEAGDWFLTQNETNLQVQSMTLARAMGLRTAYAAAPFQAEATRAILPQADMLFLNAVEAGQLRAATGLAPWALPVPDVIVTLGPQGADWYDNRNHQHQHFDAVPVRPVDTTGAGDTFTGYVLAALDRRQPMAQAIGLAMRAGALMVTRHGAADVIPDLSEVTAFHP